MSTLKTNNIAPYSGDTIHITGFLDISGSVSLAPPGSTNTSYVDYTSSTWLTASTKYQLIDISGQSTRLSWYLPTGSYNGQTVNFVLKNDGTATIAPDDVWVFTDDSVSNNGSYNGVLPWYPFAQIANLTYWRPIANAVWINSAWYLDSNNTD